MHGEHDRRLRVERLTLARAGRVVLRDLSFALGPGEALVVTGRNGIGKSTLLAALAGLLRPSRGAIAFGDPEGRSLGECVHHLGHREGLKGALSAAENLRFSAACLLGPGEVTASPGALLARVGLAAAQSLPVAFLSAGQRRRLMLARLLAARRPVWILDEPMTALDEAARDLALGLMSEHLADGGLLVAATHAPLPLPGARELALSRDTAGDGS